MMQPDPLMRALESETIEDFAGNIRELLALAVMAGDRATLATARPAVVAVEMMEAAIDAGYRRNIVQRIEARVERVSVGLDALTRRVARLEGRG